MASSAEDIPDDAGTESEIAQAQNQAAPVAAEVPEQTTFAETNGFQSTATAAPAQMESAAPREPTAPANEVCKRRGRPPGARNKPKIAKVPVALGSEPSFARQGRSQGLPQTEFATAPVTAHAASSSNAPVPPKAPPNAPGRERLPQTEFAALRPPPLMDPGEALMMYLQKQKLREQQERVEMYSRLIRGRK